MHSVTKSIRVLLAGFFYALAAASLLILAGAALPLVGLPWLCWRRLRRPTFYVLGDGSLPLRRSGGPMFITRQMIDDLDHGG